MQPILLDSIGSIDNTVQTHLSSSWVWLVIFVLCSGFIQVCIPYPMDADTAYHAAVGQLIRHHGILHSFPWTPYSWLADNYADKELLFHLLFVPLAGLNWVTAAKIVGTITGTCALFSTYLVLRAEKVRFPGVWALIPLAASCMYVYRFAIVRPHLLSISLVFIVLWAAARGRLLILATAAAIYPWSYVAWHLPIILVLITETARLLSAQRVRWKPAIVVLAGTAAGVVLHPNSLNLARLAWIQIVEVLIENAWGAKEGIELGREFLPESMEGWLTGLLVSLLMALVALFLSWRNRKDDSVSFTFALTALAFALLTVRTSRFLEYFVPFSAVSLALATKSIQWRLLPLAIFIVSLSYTWSLNSAYLLSFGRSPEIFPQSAVLFVRQMIPVGSQVFTPYWGTTGTLMLALPERRLMVALDPTFFMKKDPELYRVWHRLPLDAPANSAAIIRDRFKARYVLSGINDVWSEFFYQLSVTPGVKSFTVVGGWVLFDLGELEGSVPTIDSVKGM